MDKALARLGNNERLYIKLLKQFFTFYADSDSQFYEGLYNGDTGAAQRIAHTLKGLAGSIGATDLAGESAFLEASFANGDLDASRALAKTAFTTLTRIQNVLGQAFAAELAKENEARGHAVVHLAPEQQKRKKELLENLAALLKDDDAESVAFLSSHAAELTELLSGEIFSGLKGHVSRFEFEQALELLEKN